MSTWCDDLGLDWSTLRRRVRRHVVGAFALDADLIHMNTMLIASPPTRVRKAIDHHRAELDRDPAGYFFRRRRGEPGVLALREIEGVTRAAARYLGLSLSDDTRASSYIALTDSTTMGLALLAGGLEVRPGQEVVVTKHAFYSWRKSWELRCAATHVVCREIRLFCDPRRVTEEEVIQNVEAALSERTRVLALTWVQSNTGVKLPIRRIGRLVRALNRSRSRSDRILFCVDGVHGFGVENTSFEELCCDFLVAGCHKWLFGPRGTSSSCTVWMWARSHSVGSGGGASAGRV